MKRATLVAICVCVCVGHCFAQEKHFAANGMVVEINKTESSVAISCEAIPGYMDAMEMSFKVRRPDMLEGLRPGYSVHFTMVESGSQLFAEGIQVRKYVNGEAEPTEAARLGFVKRALDPAAGTKEVTPGQQVPDFTLVDQERRQVHISEFRGKVIALTFGYSRCPNPNYCFRLSNNLAQLQRRFSGQKSKDLQLITVLIDPANDQAEVLATYAKAWKADPAAWRFLTGTIEQVAAVAALFGMDSWDDEGFLAHPFHTAVIDRDGRMVANLEGNQFTLNQLGDLVASVLQGGEKAGTGKR